MKAIHYIAKTVQEYPSLYKASNYEFSKLLVLNTTFFGYGGGIYLFDGYPTLPRWGRRNGNLYRMPDYPYGKKKAKPFPPDFWGNPECWERFEPIGICQYSIAWEIADGVFLQEDYKQELAFLCQKALEYYHDETQFAKNIRYPKKPNPIYNSDPQPELDEETLILREQWLKLGLKQTKAIPYDDQVSKWNIFRAEQIKLINNVLIKIKPEQC